MSPPVRVAVKSVSGKPTGRVWLAASRRGLVRVELNAGRDEFLSLLERHGIAAGGDQGWVLPAARQIEEYLAGRRKRFSIRLALGELPPFSRIVLARLREVPFGGTVTYSELARRAGSPAACRAVGNIMASNPLPLVIPCHRVLAKTGLGGFGGGPELKRRLLRHEGALFDC